MTIQWSQIEAECGDFRDGFVATFRTYEGEETDEFDGRGARVVVTVTSFARHAGIPETTFRRWQLGNDTTRVVTADERVKKDAAKARRLLADPAVANAVIDTPEARTPGTPAAKAVGNIARATAAQHARDETLSRVRSETDQIERHIDAAQAELDLTEAMDRFTRQAREALRRIDSVSQPELLGEALDRVDEVTDEIRYLRSHGTTRLNAELAELGE